MYTVGPNHRVTRSWKTGDDSSSHQDDNTLPSLLRCPRGAIVFQPYACIRMIMQQYQHDMIRWCHTRESCVVGRKVLLFFKRLVLMYLEYQYQCFARLCTHRCYMLQKPTSRPLPSTGDDGSGDDEPPASIRTAAVVPCRLTLLLKLRAAFSRHRVVRRSCRQRVVARAVGDRTHNEKARVE